MRVKLPDPLFMTLLASSLGPTSAPCQQLSWPFSPFHSSSPSNSFYPSFLTAVCLQISFYLPPAPPFSVCSYLLFVSVCACVFRPVTLCQPPHRSCSVSHFLFRLFFLLHHFLLTVLSTTYIVPYLCSSHLSVPAALYSSALCAHTADTCSIKYGSRYLDVNRGVEWI